MRVVSHRTPPEIRTRINPSAKTATAWSHSTIGATFSGYTCPNTNRIDVLTHG